MDKSQNYYHHIDYIMKKVEHTVFLFSTDSNWKILFLQQSKSQITQVSCCLYAPFLAMFLPLCRWSLKQAVLKMREGQIIDLLNSPPPDAAQTQAAELDTEHWH